MPAFSPFSSPVPWPETSWASPRSLPEASCTSRPVYSQFSATAEQTSTAITATTAFRFHLALIDPFLLQIITAILPP